MWGTEAKKKGESEGGGGTEGNGMMLGKGKERSKDIEGMKGMNRWNTHSGVKWKEGLAKSVDEGETEKVCPQP